MAASRRDSSPPPPSSRPLPAHLSQIAHIVRLICDARLPLHLGRKNFSHPDDGGLRVSSVRIFPEVESDVTAYMLHLRYAAAALKCCSAQHMSNNNTITPHRFRSPVYICIGKAASKLSPTIQPFVTHTGQTDPPPVRWPSTESDDQPYVYWWWWCALMCIGGGDGVAVPRAFVADDDVTAVGFIRHFLLSHPCPTPSLILPAAMT